MESIKDIPENDDIRRDFFDLIFGDETGYLALAKATKDKEDWEQAYFKYPPHLDAAIDWISDAIENDEDAHIWYSPMLYRTKSRTADAVESCPVLWADLDEASPTKFDPPPSIVVESSPGRWQALWRLKQPCDPPTGTRFSRRLAYEFGADPSGHDLSQLLCVPATRNWKSEHPEAIVTIESVDEDAIYDIERFYHLKEIPLEGEYERPFPDELPTYDDVLHKYRNRLPFGLVRLHDEPPKDDWSRILWNIETLCFEAGLSPEETFVFAQTSGANKYERDGRSERELWREVCKARVHTVSEEPATSPITLDKLLTDDERGMIEDYQCFVDRYVKWASTKTDAAWQYHEAGGFILLSSILAENIRLDVANTKIVPNLWFMILGDTTLTRKTTAMEMAMELLFLVYEDALLATDASMEGLLTKLSKRSGKTSLFWRDEFSGMLESMKRKDYYAGMSATLARLYDGRHEVRVLKQQEYEVHYPIFLMYCGGIKSRIYELMDVSYITDGFVPRFIYIVAEPRLDDLKPLSLSTNEQESMSGDLATELSRLHADYDVRDQVVLGKQKFSHRGVVDISITQEALDRYNSLEYDFIIAGRASGEPDIYVPVLDRLAKSMLRVATLLAASRQKPPKVTVELTDILKAIQYLEGWLPHSLEVVENVGKSMSERTLERTMKQIQNGKHTRSHLMRALHLSARDADWILDTLEQRGMILRHKAGKTERIFPTFGFDHN